MKMNIFLFSTIKKVKEIKTTCVDFCHKRTQRTQKIFQCVFAVPQFRNFAILTFIAVVCVAQETAKTPHEIGGLKLPLKRHANGKVEVFLSADKAWFDADTVSAEGNICVLMLSEDGTTNGTIRAVKGEFNRTEMTAFCQGPVMMNKDPVCIMGEDFRWDAEKEKAVIEKNAVLVINNGNIIEN